MTHCPAFVLQIAYAMRMSMQDSAGSSGGGASGSNDDKMEVDQEAAKDKKGDEDYEEALNDPAVLQVLKFTL